MVGRLIADVFRRTWWLHALGATQVAVFWIIPAVMPMSGVGAFTSLSMVVAFGLGPFVAAFAMNRPEMLLRPLSSRDLWRAVWLYSVVAVPLVLALAKAVPTLLLSPISRAPLAGKLQALWLSALCDAVYCGSLLVFLALAWRVSRRDVGRRAWRGVCLAAFFGGVLWAPLAFTTASAGTLAIGASASVLSLLLAPANRTRPERTIEWRAVRRRAVAPAGFVESLSGFQIVAWTYAWLLGAGVLAITCWFMLIATLMPIGDQDPLSRAVPLAAFHPALFLLRRLRTMPFTPWQLTTLLMIGPVINTLAICAGAVLGSHAFSRDFAEITLPLVLFTVGGGAFLIALYIRLLASRGSQAHLGAIVIFVVAGNIAERFGERAAPAAIGLAGAALFLAAVFKLHRSVTRDNRTFRSIQRLELPRP